MVVAIETPYVDTAASQLTWVLGREPLGAVACSRPRVREARAELRVLGASHQVLVRGSGATYSETVACLPGQAAELPPRACGEVEGWHYVFDSAVEAWDEQPFTDRVRELIATLGDQPGALVASFPGSPLAVTALAMTEDGPPHLGWRTWHAYPQTYEIVTTTTQVRPQ